MARPRGHPTGARSDDHPTPGPDDAAPRPRPRPVEASASALVTECQPWVAGGAVRPIAVVSARAARSGDARQEGPQPPVAPQPVQGLPLAPIDRRDLGEGRRVAPRDLARPQARRVRQVDYPPV